jgi:hypothetical protein
MDNLRLTDKCETYKLYKNFHHPQKEKTMKKALAVFAELLQSLQHLRGVIPEAEAINYLKLSPPTSA